LRRDETEVHFTMPRLLLLRHAKSSWAEPGKPDRERPLAPRGREAAERMAQEMSARGLLPDRILCSPARRTGETLAALLPHLPKSVDLQLVDELYEAPGDYRSTIALNGGDAASLLVVGHNPAMHATAVELIGSADRKTIADIVAKYPTGALAVIDFNGRWADIRPGGGRLSAFIRPRDLTDDPAAADDD
jgi:phosphohistidine phosphatase